MTEICATTAAFSCGQASPTRDRKKCAYSTAIAVVEQYFTNKDFSIEYQTVLFGENKTATIEVASYGKPKRTARYHHFRSLDLIPMSIQNGAWHE